MGKGNILVVDDSPLVVDVISKYLSASGFDIITANDGIEAIEKAFRELPDLIILDVMMPKMNGYQTCRLLKTDHETCDIPIVMLTVKDQASSKYWGIQTGADAYLSKEFEQTLLLKTIETLLQKKQKRPVPKSLIRETSLISAVDIVSKVNEHLDRKLFEATVLNEMSSLVEKRIENFEDTVTVVMETLAKVLEHDVGIFVTIKESGVECFFKIRHAVSEQRLKEIQEYTRNYLKVNNICLSPTSVMEILDGDKTQQSQGAEEQRAAYFVVPIHCGGKMGGVVILAHNVSEVIDSKEMEFFKSVVRQAYVIIENSWLYNKVKKLAITDSLTGIYNHGFLYECLCKEYARTERYRLPLSFLMMDVDHFKKINDTYGHPLGDDVLYKLAQIFKNNIRSCDTLGRYGGEEFSIILPEAKMEDGVNLAERMRKEIEQHNFGGADRTIRCTVSIGISSYPDPGIKNVEDLIQKADKALYHAKAEGRNRVCIV